jgi:hypothetical protein
VAQYDGISVTAVSPSQVVPTPGTIHHKLVTGIDDPKGEPPILMAKAALLLASEPLFLGHAGLATHDVPATAGVALSLFAFARWRAERDTGHAALAGAAYGFAVLCKLSCIVFVPVACAAILLIRRERPRLRDLAIAGAVAAHVVCVGYVFVIDRLFDSLALLSQMDRAGMLAYLHGELRTTGWWTYFPIAVGLKTTLPLLALALLAMFVPRARPYLAAAAAMLLVMTQSTLDIGARYALPLYVPLTVGAAMAVTSARSRLLRGAAIALLVAQTIVSARAHPDYIASFNALAGNEPSRWLIDSNLEWGQDAKRLGQTARALHIDRLKLSMMTQADLDTLGFPPHEEIDPAVETHGWIAVGEHKYRIRQAQRGGRLWLDGLPYQRIGKSIRLYHVP